MDNTPQLENGYIRIANELYEAILRFPFTKRELLIVLAIVVSNTILQNTGRN
jgi:Bacteriophage replication protein O